MSDKNIKELKEHQQLTQEIKELEKKKKDIDFILQHEQKVKILEQSRNEEKAKNRKLINKIDELESNINLILETEKFKPSQLSIEKKTVDKGSAIANFVFSDWHIEERVRAEEIEFKNEFNLTIAEKRVERAFVTGLHLVEIERNASDIKKLVILLIGDLISGYIHDDLVSSNFKTPAEAILFVEDLLYKWISWLEAKGDFEEIEIICKPGNHSRYTQGKAIHYKGMVEKTFEWILFHQLAKTFDRLKKHKIKFVIPLSSRYTFSEFEYLIRVQHGEAFRWDGGIGGATIPINKKILRWNKKSPVYLDIFAHLHRYENGNNFICNGSLIGYNQLAEQSGYEFQQPIQAFILISKKRGLICNRPIYLD